MKVPLPVQNGPGGSGADFLATMVEHYEGADDQLSVNLAALLMSTSTGPTAATSSSAGRSAATAPMPDDAIRRPLIESLERWHFLERVMALNYCPLVTTPMIAPTRACDGMAALSPNDAAEWMVTAVRDRPIRIAPRKALALRAIDVVAPRRLNRILEAETDGMNARVCAADTIGGNR